MDVFYMINKKQMRNMTPDDRIGISIMEHILEKHIQWKKLNDKEKE